jgi:hypothetical protein
MRKNTARSHSDAVFIGWQKTPEGKSIPLYNITMSHHPLRGSTVSDRTLHRLNLRIPQTPMFRELEKRVQSVELTKLRGFAKMLFRSLAMNKNDKSKRRESHAEQISSVTVEG